jgi:hypothetical protein
LHCSWPLKFFETRPYFNRKEENLPYIEWLRDAFADSEEESENEEGNARFGLSSDNKHDLHEDICQASKGDEGIATCDYKSVVRRFMEGMTGDEENLPYRNQVEVVAGFGEKASLNNVDSEASSTENNVVILLDDMTHGGVIPRTQEQTRPYRGMLTSKQLREELGKAVRLLPTMYQIFKTHIA